MEKVILTPRNLILPEATTLDSEILGAYREGIDPYKGRARQVLDIFSDKGGVLAGSNCFAPIKLREFFPEGARLSRMGDLDRATEINPKFLKGYFSDTGLVLRTAEDSYKNNDFLAKDLAKQLKRRRIALKHPKIIYFDALDLREDENSSYGLAYNLSEGAKLGENIIDAPELIENMRFKTINERGVPIKDDSETRTSYTRKDDSGTRTSYTRKDGLSRFFLSRLSNVDSCNGLLADSDDIGRVVIIKTGEAGSQIFEQYLKNLKDERDRQLSEINERYQEAERVLKGN